MRRYTAIAAAVAIAGAASAQQIKTEVSVERTVDTTLDEAVRPRGITPAVVTPPVQMPRLAVGEYTDPGTVTTEICPMEPARWADTVAHTPYRGYASVGYLPAFNLGANAGYRFVDTPRLNAGAWMQYTGSSYRTDLPYYPKATLNTHFMTIGADGAWHPNHKSWLTADVTYTFSSVGRPLSYAQGFDYAQKANDVDLNAMWRSRAGRVKYHAGIGADYFGFSKDMPAEMAPGRGPLSQTGATLQAGVGLCESGSDIPWLGLDAAWRVLGTNCCRFADGSSWRWGSATLHQGSFRPYFILDVDDVHLRAGINLSVAAGASDSHVRVAPDISVTYTPAAAFTFYANLTGGEYLNDARRLYSINPYLYPYNMCGRSNVRMRADGGVNILPLAALKINLSGGYAVGRDIAMPVVLTTEKSPWAPLFAPVNTDSWYAGAEISYNFRNLVAVKAHAKVAGSNRDGYTWIDWYDRAKYQTGAAIEVTPIDNLSVTADYSLRIRRRGTLAGTEITEFSLGNMRSLSLGATYRINPQLTAFASLENLLGTRYALISGVPAPRVHGLAGIAYKF